MRAKSSKKTLLTGLVVAAIAVVVLQQRPSGPPTPESCKDYREQMRELASNDSGFAGVIAVTKESVMTQALQDRYGTLTAEQCSARLPVVKSALEALSHTAWADKMPQASNDATAAVQQCHDKRVAGELKTHEDSAKCSAPMMTTIFQRIGYPYMDLVDEFNAKKIEEAQKLDKSTLGGSEDEKPFADLALKIAEQEAEHLGKK